MGTKPELKQYIPIRTVILFLILLALVCSSFYAIKVEPAGIRAEDLEEAKTNLEKQFATRPVGTVLFLLLSVVIIVCALGTLWAVACIFTC